jgi:hypothetical protein
MKATGAHKTSVFLSGLLMLLLSCSWAFILAEVDHDCAHDECPICIVTEHTLMGGGGGSFTIMQHCHNL